MTYTVEIKRSAEKEMESLPRDVHQRVTAKILSLETNQRPSGVRKLQGTDGYRIRVAIIAFFTLSMIGHVLSSYTVSRTGVKPIARF